MCAGEVTRGREMERVMEGQVEHRRGSSISEGYYKRIADMLNEKGEDGGSS